MQLVLMALKSLFSQGNSLIHAWLNRYALQSGVLP